MGDKKINTTVRLEEEASEKVLKLVEQSGASQSDVIRLLVNVALGVTTPNDLTRRDAVPDEVKSLLMDCANLLADIRTELNRIGSNINIRRKNYNSKRKEIQDKIDQYDVWIAQEEEQQKDSPIKKDIYKKLKLQEERRTLQDKLDKFDDDAPNLITENEWNQFNIIKISFENLMIQMGGALNDIYSKPLL